MTEAICNLHYGRPVQSRYGVMELVFCGSCVLYDYFLRPPWWQVFRRSSWLSPGSNVARRQSPAGSQARYRSCVTSRAGMASRVLRPCLPPLLPLLLFLLRRPAAAAVPHRAANVTDTHPVSSSSSAEFCYNTCVECTLSKNSEMIGGYRPLNTGL